MGRNPLNRVRCPRCNKVGTLRLKQPHSIVVSHYDPVKARQGRGKGMRHHYIGSRWSSPDRILEKYQDRLSEPYFVALKVVLKRLMASLVTKQSDYKVIEYDDQLSKVLLALNELRQIRRSEGVIDRRLQWSIRCPTCKQPHRMYAIFKGIRENEGVLLRCEKA